MQHRHERSKHGVAGFRSSSVGGEALRRRLHDLNNLMTSLLGNVELAELLVDDGEWDQVRARLQSARTACLGVNKIVGELRATLAAGSEEAGSPVASPESEMLADHHPMTVLLVDDTPELLVPMADFLERSGFRVLSAHNGAEAVSVLEESGENIDALVSDVRMPGMTGVELADEARRRHPKLGVVLMSGYCDPMSVGERDGTVFLHKPFGWKGLVQAIGNVVRH